MSWSFTLPYERPPKGLHSNDRAHWRVKAKSTQEVRRLVALLAREIPRMKRCGVQITWCVPDARKRDEDGPEGLCKAIYDALGSDRGISARIVPDDTSEFMEKPRLKIRIERGITAHFLVEVVDLSDPFLPDNIRQLKERLQ